MEFFSINLGNVLTILSFLGGGLAFMYTIKGDVKLQSSRLSAIETELYELRKTFIAQARQEERVAAMDQRMLIQGQRIDAQSNRIDAQGERITSVDNRLILTSAKVDAYVNGKIIAK